MDSIRIDISHATMLRYLVALLVAVCCCEAFSFNCRRRSLTKTCSQKSAEAEVSSLQTTTRNDFLKNMFIASTALPILSSSPVESNAAPPFAIMSEELGYFPVTDEKTGETVMVPARTKRESTDQAIELAKYLQSTKAVMYGTFWCPHCRRQKELFGKEAWKYITYVECSPKGYKSKYATCLSEGIDGYPSWKFGNGKSQGGEMELIDIATKSGFSKKFKFDASLEEGQVPSLGGGGCS